MREVGKAGGGGRIGECGWVGEGVGWKQKVVGRTKVNENHLFFLGFRWPKD